MIRFTRTSMAFSLLALLAGLTGCNDKQTVDLIERLQTLRAERKSLVDQVKGLEKTLRDDVILLQAYKDSFQESAIPVGTELGTVTLSDGRVLERAVISSVSLPTVVLRHTNGVGGFPVESLPAKLQKTFRLKPKDIPNPDVDARNILSSRPKFLLTSEELQQQREQEFEKREWERAKERSEKERRRESEAEQRRKGQEERRIKRAELSARIEQLSIQRNSLQTAMNNVPRGSVNRPRSQVDISNDKNKYLRQITAVEAEISKLRAEMNAIR